MNSTRVPQNVGTGFQARAICCFFMLLICSSAIAQDQPKDQSQPQVRVNYLNVCSPSDEDQQIIRKALASVPPPKFVPDFEISRGKASMPDSPAASYVRIRHEYPESIPFITAQYSLSVDEKSVVEDLVFRSREAKDVIQVQLEDTITGAQDTRSVLATDTPVDRIKLERFGKNSVALARCPAADQKIYEPLFQMASELMTKYRTALGTKRLVPRELAALGIGAAHKPAAKSSNPPPKTSKP